MAANGISGDRDFCRAMLPRVSRTFAINTRLLRGPLAEAVRTGYLLCRAADTLEDAWPGSPEEIGERFELFQAALAGGADEARDLAARAEQRDPGRADFALLAGLSRVLRVYEALPGPDREAVGEGVRTLAAGMRRYACRAAGRPPGSPYIDTEDELHDYCWVVAGCVGVMVTRLFGAESETGDAAASERRLTLAPVVGEALQLTNILLDWPTDIRRGRCHVPADWLAAGGLAPADLVRDGRPEVRAIARRLEAMARGALARVPDYLDLVPARHVRYRLFCLWPALWALGSLRHARRDPDFPWGERRPRLPRGELWGSALSSLLRARDGRALRRMVAAEG